MAENLGYFQLKYDQLLPSAGHTWELSKTKDEGTRTRCQGNVLIWVVCVCTQKTGAKFSNILIEFIF